MYSVEELPHIHDVSQVFAKLARKPWAMVLDSCYECAEGGRYDILLWSPAATLVTRGAVTEIRGADGTSQRSYADPLRLLQEELKRFSSVSESIVELPFCGGAVGYFGYDLGRRFEQLSEIVPNPYPMPEMAVGIYHHAVVVDHLKRRTWWVADEFSHPLWDEVSALLGQSTGGKIRDTVLAKVAVEALAVRPDKAGYGKGFNRIQHYIREGDCYQVNLARRFSAVLRGDPWALYRRLRENNPAPYAAYLNFPFAQVLSSSPERFLRVQNNSVETRPIKGTRPRSIDPAEDQRLFLELANSDKDRAENLMIVDLLRNDLGKSCAVGSVAVKRLFKIESFARVHHLVSTVTGRLASGRTSLDLLRGAFPGGSITGVPKLRAMAIIEELEPQRRGVYCGAIGYVGFNGDMDTNIAIRTLTCANNELSFWTGGGIVADSDMEEEFQETMDKAAAIISALGMVIEH